MDCAIGGGDGGVNFGDSLKPIGALGKALIFGFSDSSFDLSYFISSILIAGLSGVAGFSSIGGLIISAVESLPALIIGPPVIFSR